MKRLIISAPFGNHVTHPEATSTAGTYTLTRRAGWWKRLWRVVSTVRYYPRAGAWINRLGLPNPGLELAVPDVSGKILSVHGLDPTEWWRLALLACTLKPAALELNLSCPNVGRMAVAAATQAALDVVGIYLGTVIAKLGPVRWMDFAVPLYDAGVRAFHLCNTIPTPGGGLSGKPLKPYSLWAAEEVKARWGDDVDVTAGGGVTGPDDVSDYLAAGADRVAVGSACINPFRRRARLDACAARLKEFWDAREDPQDPVV